MPLAIASTQPKFFSTLLELRIIASGLWESCGLAAPLGAGLYTHALINPCPAILGAGGPPKAWPIRPRPLTGQGPSLTADVYVGFGTVPSFANARTDLIAAVRACTSRGMRVVVTAPGEDLRRDLAALDEGLVDAREFVSLPDLFRSCKAVISHAGAGTVLASLAAGVPVVLLPRGSPSQLRMADACHRAGVGRRCEAAGLDAALEEVTGGVGFSQAAAVAAAQIAGMPPASSIIPLLEGLVTDGRP